MPEEDNIREMRRELERLKDRVDQIGHVQAQQVKADGRLEEYFLSYFEGEGGPTKAEMFLAADGDHGVTAIAEVVGVDQAYASRSLKRMEEMGMLGSQWIGGSKMYHRSFLAKELQLVRKVRRIADGT